jgi:DNA-binding MarR family transcriptional regulator
VEQETIKLNIMRASYQNFLQQINSGKITTDKQRVYQAIKKNPNITLRELRKTLKMKHQTVSARLSDLLDLGVVEICGTKETVKNGHILIDSRLKSQEVEIIIENNQEERNKERFKRSILNVLSFDDRLCQETKNNLLKLIK